MFALLVLGPQGCGKDTLVAALRKAGARCDVWMSVPGENRVQNADDPFDVRTLEDAGGISWTRAQFTLLENDRMRLDCDRSSDHVFGVLPSMALRFQRATTEGAVPAWPDRAAGAIVGMYPEVREGFWKPRA